jgi:hypothetical protein
VELVISYQCSSLTPTPPLSYVGTSCRKALSEPRNVYQIPDILLTIFGIFDKRAGYDRGGGMS